MRTTKLNRALSLLLVLVMVLTLMPTAALADPVGNSGSYTPEDGDKVVIYNPANMKALSSNYSGHYNTGKDVSLSDGKLTGYTAAEVWTVGIDADGNYTFSTSAGNKLSMDTQYSSMPLDKVNTTWKISAAKTDGCFYIRNAARGNYIEWYADMGNWSSYYQVNNEALFAQAFYKVTDDTPDTPEDAGLPEEGDEFVIYNQNAEGVLAMQNDAYCAKNAPATITDGKAAPSNGAVVFKVEKNGEYLRFYNETYGYLCSNGTGKNAFYSKDFSETVNDVKVKTEDADWLVRTCSGGVGGYEMESRSAKYSGHSQWLEYYSDCYQTYSMYKVEDYTIYSFFFYPLADDVKVVNGVVIKPVIEFPESVPAAYVGDDYEITVAFNSIFGIDDPWTEYSIRDAKGNLIGGVQGNTDVEVMGDYTTGDGTVHFTIFDSDIAKAAENGSYFTFTAAFKDPKGNEARASIKVEIKDEPIITDLTPVQGSETGDNKTPTISAVIKNMGNDAAVTMTLNDEAVDAQYSVTQGVGTVSYTPAQAMADGKVNVSVTVTRKDGVSSTKTWSFTVGTAQYQLYFGQLHSHTQYSDGSGTLDDALNYVANLPESANVQFVAFTDHSNYFDSSSSPNPEAALYDTTLVKDSDAKHSWSTYKSTVAKFNEEHSGSVVALAGFEMTWSGGPGHINTFNTPGVVSRNNSTLNNKTSDAGMKAYYALLSQGEGVDSISQFNHPGTTFGNFSDFSYWDAVIDSRMYLVEAGNGEGQIGAGGYYPSYEQYILALDKGWHLAPSNNQDNHKGKWGNANDARDVILTDDFSEEGIYQAIRDMRVYSTEDKNLEINYTVNDLPLGSQIKDIPEKLNINVSVYDPDGTDSTSKVEVVVNSGKVAYEWVNAADLANGNFSVELNPDYTYYFIRVTQADGDIAVTAPVWVGESLKLGISAFECGTSTPVTGEELELTTTIFNSEASDATVTSVVYTTDGDKVIGTDTNEATVKKGETASVSFKYTPTVAKLTKITVTVNLRQDGKDYTFSKDIELNVLNSEKLVYIGIDAAHYNEYVAGNYKDSMGNFGNLAAADGVRTVMLKTSEELIAACSNAKYKALILTAPSRRLADAQSNPKVYTADELAAIKAFNKAGGIVILAGWSDNYENYEVIQNDKSIMHMAATQNSVLEALGSSLRISDDATYDDVRSAADGVDKWRLYFNTYGDSFLTEGVIYDADHPYDRLYTEVFSHYGGASVYAVGADGNATSTLPSTVSPIVYAHATTYSVDVDGDGLGGDSIPKYAYASDDNRLMAMASEQLPGQGLIIVSGAAFMSNFEVQATISDNGSEKNYSNYKICENLVNYINPATVTDIADVQAETEEGVSYTIEGIVTSNASGYDKNTAFFDCIYVQDGTAGINIFPVSGDYKIGDKVRITGLTSSYQSERQLAVKSIEKIGEGTPVVPANVTAKQINDGSVLGSLVKVSGTVTRVEKENGLVQTIMVKDASGQECRLFIDGYITVDKDVENLKVGCNVTATGLASIDDTFALDGKTIAPRIRIRDRADIVCSDGGEVVTKLPFTDVSSEQWFYKNVEYVYNNKLMNGMTETTFAPDSTMTREMFAMVIYRMADTPSVEGMTMPFTDVPTTSYAYNAILWAYNNGIVKGVTDTTFEPGSNITRAQTVTMLYRYAKEPAVSGTLSFTDADRVGDWALNAVLWASQAGIVSGYPDGSFGPDNTATRAQMAKILQGYCEFKK